jgi:hypothetical protein
VDLVLSQGMLGAGWHAHTLNAPGKFLVSAPEHGTPKRACAYLVTDDDVASVVAYHGPRRPPPDEVSRTAGTWRWPPRSPLTWTAGWVPSLPSSYPARCTGLDLAGVWRLSPLPSSA